MRRNCASFANRRYLYPAHCSMLKRWIWDEHWEWKGNKTKLKEEWKRKRKRDINEYKTQTNSNISYLYAFIESKNFLKQEKKLSANSIAILKPITSGYSIIFTVCFGVVFLRLNVCMCVLWKCRMDLQAIVVFFFIISFKPDDLARCQYREKRNKTKLIQTFNTAHSTESEW